MALIRAVDATRREERDLEAEIIERLDAHADAHIFTWLPPAGHGVRAAPLLAEIGDVRARFPDEESLAALAGVAPVTRASGQNHTSDSAGRPTRNSATPSSTSPTTPAAPAPGPNGLRRAIDRGKRHPHAMHILARAWARVIWRCWHDHTPYDPHHHRRHQTNYSAARG